MVDRRTLRLLLPRQLRRLPADLTAMIAVTILVNTVVFLPVIRDTPLRIALGLPFVLFVPGYVFVAALFPEHGTSPVEDSSDLEGETDDHTSGDTSLRSGIDSIERVALSFGLSIAIVPLLGLALNFTPWGIRLVPIMVTVSGFTVIATAIAAVRRWQLPADERFRVPYEEWLAAGRIELLEPDTRADAVLNVVLVASVLLAIGTVSYAVMVPPQGEQFSAIYILTEDENGELVADNYPSEFEVGESQEIVVGVDNHEHQTTDYTIVVVEQDVETVGNETVVEEQNEIDRFETALAHNETWLHEYDLSPTMVGEDVRIVWLLYPDDVPAEPSRENTEYHVHLWVDVNESDDSQARVGLDQNGAVDRSMSWPDTREHRTAPSVVAERSRQG